MKPVSLAVYFVGVAAFAVSLFLPANSDWLGFFWATFALEIAMRGPQGIADYPLFLLVSAANVLVLLTPLAFAGAKAWGRIVAYSDGNLLLETPDGSLRVAEITGKPTEYPKTKALIKRN